MTREKFMEFFRREDFHEQITPDDAHEIFTGVLHGSSDISQELFQEVCDRYMTGFEVVLNEPEHGKETFVTDEPT